MARCVAILLLGLGCAAGCAPRPGKTARSSRAGAIVGGSADTTHDAVMALLQMESATTAYACSGTTIAQVGTAAFLLTAAHCVVRHAGDAVALPVTAAAASALTVLPGPDWSTSRAQGHTYSVAAISVAPGYDGSPDSPADVAVVRYVSSANLASIPILEPADDRLAVATALTLVGYGVTELDDANTVRRTVDRPIDSLTAQHIFISQTDGKGQCNGDSGGPALVASDAGDRVAGVIAYGSTVVGADLDCRLDGVSVRVSSLASFIHSVVAAAGSPDAGAVPDAGADADAKPASDGGTGPACGKVTDSRPACAACVNSRCCTEAAICGADPLCLGCGTSPLPSCQSYPPSATLTACLATCSGNPCGVSLDAGGPPDAASSDGRVADGSTPESDGGLDAAVSGADGGDTADAARDAARPDAAQLPEAGAALDAAPAADARPADAGPDGAADGGAARTASGGCGCEADGGLESRAMGLWWLVAVFHARRRPRLVQARREHIG